MATTIDRRELVAAEVAAVVSYIEPGTKFCFTNANYEGKHSSLWSPKQWYEFAAIVKSCTNFPGRRLLITNENEVVVVTAEKM